jgi:hypothetical protein
VEATRAGVPNYPARINSSSMMAERSRRHTAVATVAPEETSKALRGRPMLVWRRRQHAVQRLSSLREAVPHVGAVSPQSRTPPPLAYRNLCTGGSDGRPLPSLNDLGQLRSQRCSWMWQRRLLRAL